MWEKGALRAGEWLVMHPAYERALDMMAAQMPRKDICAELGVVPSTLTKYAKMAKKAGDTRDFSPTSVSGGRGRLSPWREDALKLALSKVPVREIAQRLGVSRQRVYQVLKEFRDSLPSFDPH